MDFYCIRPKADTCLYGEFIFIHSRILNVANEQAMELWIHFMHTFRLNGDKHFVLWILFWIVCFFSLCFCKHRVYWHVSYMSALFQRTSMPLITILMSSFSMARWKLRLILLRIKLPSTNAKCSEYLWKFFSFFFSNLLTSD